MNPFEAIQNEFIFEQVYFDALKNMKPEDYEFVEEAIRNDPKKNLFGPLDKGRRANMCNHEGEFPLYIVSKYNHVNAIELLFKCNAFFLSYLSMNHYMLPIVDI